MQVDERIERASAGAGIRDARHRFVTVFDALNRDHGRSFPHWRPTGEALHVPGPPGNREHRAVNLGPARLPLRLLIVPGLGASLFGRLGRPLPDAVRHVETLGYRARILPVESLSSSRRNARLLSRLIGETLHHPDQPIVVLGYSKGAVDVLSALAADPSIGARVGAVVSLSGVIGGTALADDLPDPLLGLLHRLRRWLALGGFRSLERRRRRAWLAANRLPDGVRLYSVVSHAGRSRISGALRLAYERLRLIDPVNDGQVLRRDQIVPGSTLLADLDADHWAVALPLARHLPWLRGLGLGANDFPREILLEAILKVVEEDLLAARRPTG